MSVGLKHKVTDLLNEEIDNRANKMKMVATKTKGITHKEGTIFERKVSDGHKEGKKKTVKVMPKNYHQYLLISDSIELSYMFFNYLAMQDKSDNPLEFTNNPI